MECLTELSLHISFYRIASLDVISLLRTTREQSKCRSKRWAAEVLPVSSREGHCP